MTVFDEIGSEGVPHMAEPHHADLFYDEFCDGIEV
jgi:hypothetical protein